MARLVAGWSPARLSSRLPPEQNQSNLEPAANPEECGETYGNMPLRPDGECRVRGVNSSAQPPVHSDVFSQDAA